MNWYEQQPSPCPLTCDRNVGVFLNIYLNKYIFFKFGLLNFCGEQKKAHYSAVTELKHSTDAVQVTVLE